MGATQVIVNVEVQIFPQRGLRQVENTGVHFGNFLARSQPPVSSFVKYRNQLHVCFQFGAAGPEGKNERQLLPFDPCLCQIENLILVGPEVLEPHLR